MDKGKEAHRIFTAGKLIDVFDIDIFLVSYPRSGNLWLRWLLAVSVKGRLDVSNRLISGIVPDIYEVSNEYLLALEKPRVIKSHEKYNAAYPKVIYLYRDVRHVMISLFHYLKRGRGMERATISIPISISSRQGGCIPLSARGKKTWAVGSNGGTKLLSYGMKICSLTQGPCLQRRSGRFPRILAKSYWIPQSSWVASRECTRWSAGIGQVTASRRLAWPGREPPDNGGIT